MIVRVQASWLTLREKRWLLKVLIDTKAPHREFPDSSKLFSVVLLFQLSQVSIDSQSWVGGRFYGYSSMHIPQPWKALPTLDGVPSAYLAYHMLTVSDEVAVESLS